MRKEHSHYGTYISEPADAGFLHCPLCSISPDSLNSDIVGSYLIEFHPEALLQSVVNFTINFGQLMGKAALGTAVGGLILMHKDGLTLSQSVSYYWDGQNKAGKAATVAVGALAGWYGAMQAIQIYNTVKSIFIELKNAYAQTKANIAASQQQDAGITDPIVAAAA